MIHNLIIIGSGPSGYTAAIYASRATLSPILFAGEKFGGQLMDTTEVENFPGFSSGIAGPQLMDQMRNQALRFGTQIFDANVSKVDFASRPFKVFQDEKEFLAHTVIISTGAEAITLNIPREKELFGRGVSICAVCDAPFYRDKIVYVVGGGDSAMEDTLALTRFAAKVFLVVRRNELKASKIMQNRVIENSKVEILWNSEVIGLTGDPKLTHLRLKNNQSHVESVVHADGLFFAIGHRPNSDLFDKSIKKDEKGYILTTLNGLSSKDDIYDIWVHKYPTMTSIDGVFAAGDVVDFRYRQAITASAYGTMAALDVEKWLENHGIEQQGGN